MKRRAIERVREKDCQIEKERQGGERVNEREKEILIDRETKREIDRERERESE